MIVLHILEIYYKPPLRYPDLYPALFSLFGAFNLLGMYIYCVVWQLFFLEVIDSSSSSSSCSSSVGNKDNERRLKNQSTTSNQQISKIKRN